MKVREEGVFVFLKLQVLHALHGEKVLCFLRKEVSLQRFRGFLTQNGEP